MKADGVHVAVGVIRNPQGQVLIARRPESAHQGGCWEFPGGKLEAGESVRQALQRELDEELGIEVGRSRPLIRIAHHYPDRSVLLDVHEILDYVGSLHGRERQTVQWVAPAALADFDFPAANQAILRALQLPAWYLVTGNFADQAQGLARLEQALRHGIRLVQLRAPRLAAHEYTALARQAIRLCHAREARILLNAAPQLASELGADGVHLNSARLMAASPRAAVPPGLLRAASVHDLAELEQANRLGVDFSVVAPVFPTTSHPGAATLGWSGFQELAQQARHPVYALGGMHTRMLEQVWAHGGQGIAAIRSLWTCDETGA